LTLTVGASADDARLSDLGYDDSETAMQVGGTGTTNVNFGQGWRFTGATLAAADTVTAARIDLMKSGTQWNAITYRLTAIDEDNTATFSSGSPPGSRAIVSASITNEDLNLNKIDGTVYGYPTDSGQQSTLGAAIEAVVNRGGWASGNALGIVDNSDQDTSAYTGFGRSLYHTYDSSTASSEPQLVITYTAGAGGSTPGFRRSLLGVGA
jgi:hypothetical protein